MPEQPRDTLMVARTVDLRQARPDLDPIALGAIEAECGACHEPVIVSRETQMLLMTSLLVCTHCWDGDDIVVVIGGPTVEAILQ